ncbi:ABC transporter permease [Methanobacterium sp.]|uniref:ABC transporter permease n=1 Tax=Methanobacterium sp. TaxID=2164 RepID=UPI0025CDA523|nr:ABC transporter permease [Methanobacterium sp.]MBI5458755.1 ABC transporter permease [Methanobacterium sp.]
MKFISVAIKDFKELIRDRRGLFMILLFPMFFMIIFGIVYGNMGQTNETYNLAVVNLDEGAKMPLTNEEVNFGDNLTEIFRDSEYEDSDVKLFNVINTSESSANKLIQLKEADAMIVIPKNFSQTIVDEMEDSIAAQTTGTTSSNNNDTLKLIISGDSSSMGFGVSQVVLIKIIGEYHDNLVANIQSQTSGSSAEPLKLFEGDVGSVSGTESFSQFDFLAPGMMLFAILLLATTVAASLTREVEKGTLARLRISKMRSFDMLFGALIPWSIVAAIQVLILLTVALIMGFNWQGGLNSIVLAMFIGVIGGIGSIALGMIIASFAKNDTQAFNLGIMVVVPTSFVVGAFFQLPQVVIGEIMGRSFQIYDILPWTHILNALKSVLIYGNGLSAITYDLAWSAVLTAIIFVIGMGLFSRFRLSVEN